MNQVTLEEVLDNEIKMYEEILEEAKKKSGGSNRKHWIYKG